MNLLTTTHSIALAFKRAHRVNRDWTLDEDNIPHFLTTNMLMQTVYESGSKLTLGKPFTYIEIRIRKTHLDRVLLPASIKPRFKNNLIRCLQYYAGVEPHDVVNNGRSEWAASTTSHSAGFTRYGS